MTLNKEELNKIHQQYKLGLNVDDEMEQVFEHIETQGRELSKYIEAFKPLNTNAVGMLIDSNKELKAENKELKEKLESALVSYDDYQDRWMQATAKLKAIESNKVIQFSDKANNSGCSNKNECMLENGDIGNWAMCISDILKAGERYTVTISKETKCN